MGSFATQNEVFESIGEECEAVCCRQTAGRATNSLEEELRAPEMSNS